MEADAAEKQLKLLYNGLKNKGSRIGNACSSSVQLYNQLTSQFDALKEFNQIEMDKEYAMTVDIKALYDQEMNQMDSVTKKKAVAWKKHFETQQA